MAGNRKALIVANDEYEHEALQDLRAPAADAAALSQVLGDPGIGAFEVEVAHNEPAHVIQGRIEGLLSTAKLDDVVLIHFSCHGLKDASGTLFFAAANTIPDRLASTTVPADFVHRCMRQSRSRAIVLLLDCCFGGAFPRGSAIRAAGNASVLDSFPQERPESGRGSVVITASSEFEFSLEEAHRVDDNKPRPSYFTSALVEGLTTGEADQDEDGWVSVGELYDYVYDKVRERNPAQTPGNRGDLAGKIYIARSRRRRVPPVISPELQGAITGDRYARLGAVSELQLLLAHDDISAAKGAYEALRQLAVDDSRTIVDAASEALKDAVITVSQAEVSFGRVERGSVPPHREIRLLGPPIARVCTADPSDDWIHVERQADGVLDIWVDTTGTGARRGTVALRGPGGQASVTVDIDLFLPSPQPAKPDRESGSGPPERRPAARLLPRLPPAARLAPGPYPHAAGTAPEPPVIRRARPAADVSPGHRRAADGRGWATTRRRRGRMRVVLAAAVALVAAVGVTAFAVFAGWPGHTGSESGTFGAVLKIPKYSPGSLAFSQDGKILAVGASSSDGNHGSTYLVSLVTHRVTATLTDKAADQVDSVAFNPNGKTLAVANSSGGINVWSLADNKIVTNLSGASFLGATFSFAFSSDGKSLAEGDVSLFGGGSNNLSPLTTAIRLWNLSTGKVAASRTFPTGANTTILMVAFNPDGKTVAANIDGGNIYLWNLADQRMVKLFTIPGSQEVSSLKFSPDGTTLAVGDMNGNVYLWSLAGHRIAATLTGPRKSAVEAVAFSPDGTTLAAGNSNGRTYLWAVASHHVTATLTDPRGNGVNSVAYSPKGTTLAVGDDNGSIYIWNIRKGTS